MSIVGGVEVAQKMVADDVLTVLLGVLTKSMPTISLENPTGTQTVLQVTL